METIEYRTVDKSTWGPGPWADEPDKIQWMDEATRLPCLIVRFGDVHGALCGYVGVPPGHPAYGRDYSEVEDLEAHGGVNYSHGCNGTDEARGICHVAGDGEADHVWWFGFDCAHAGDLCPRIEALLPEHLTARRREILQDEYRDVEYVREQVRLLSAQLALRAYLPGAVA